jgi:hypothetical protein
MMFKAVMVLATVMVTAGGAAILSGWDVVINERGWSKVIGGSVMLSTGLLIVALCGLLAHAKRVWGAEKAPEKPENRDESAKIQPEIAVKSPAIEPHFTPSEPVFTAPAPVSVAHEEPVPAPAESPAHPDPMTAFAETFEQSEARIDPAYKPSRYHDAPQEPSKEPSAHDLLADLVPPPVPMPQPKPDEWSQTASLTHSEPTQIPAPQPSLLDRLLPQDTQPLPPPIKVPEPVFPPAERLLVASYTAGGVGYFMYSDQTIEAEMAIGRYRFASMDELRHFVETNEGGIKIGESSQI